MLSCGLLLTPVSFADPGLRQPASLTEACQNLVARIFRTERADPFFNDPAAEPLRQSLLQLHQSQKGITLTDEMASLVIAEAIPIDQLRPLFITSTPAGNERFLEPRELANRLERLLGAYPSTHGAIGNLGFRYDSAHSIQTGVRRNERGERAWKKIESRLREALGSSPQSRQALRAEITERGRLARLDAILEDTSRFEVRLMADRAVFPNGATYPVLGRQKEGALVIGIPYRNILKTQDYFNSSIAAEYRSDPKLKKMAFWGSWMPDGRILILDQHHRTSAYHSQIGDPIPFLLEVAPDGAYRTQSYLHAMKFYTSWSSVTRQEKLQLLDKLESVLSNSALGNLEKNRMILERLEELYHRLLRLSSTRPSS